MLQICGATLLNLSLLTSDMWAVLIRIFAYHENVHLYIQTTTVILFPFLKEQVILILLFSPFLISQVDWIYFIAFAAVVVGLGFYSWYVYCSIITMPITILLFHLVSSGMVSWGVARGVDYKSKFIL
jgi:Solute carrier family 35